MERISSRTVARLPLAAVLLAAALAAAPTLVGAAADTSITRALTFLAAQQVREPLDVIIDGARVRDDPGDWPQYFHLRGADWLRVRDVSPFTVAFIHHALALVTEDTRVALDVGKADVSAARAMRRRGVSFLRGFAAPPDAPDADTFGFWPYDTDPATPDLFTTFLMTVLFQGPILGGARVPLNLPIFPSTLAITGDADVTATTYASLLDDAVIDGGRGGVADAARVFVDWRDLDAVPRRINPWWLPPGSGTFLTWLTYRTQPWPVFPNDVDLVVNANVLYALGRYGRLHVPGVREAVDTINLVTGLGLHRQGLDGISEYYPDNLVFQYAVSRAYQEGRVAGLRPAVDIFVQDLEAAAIAGADGSVHWDQGDPQLNTAFAVLTLLNAGRHSRLVDPAVGYLRAQQSADGGFGEATFFFGRTDGGQVFEFSSAAFTTAMALEAFARDRLLHCGRGPARRPFEALQACR